MPNTIAQNLARLQAAKTAIGAAITAKGGTVASGDGLEEFATDIGTIPSGGGGGGTTPNAVNFYDYDGTIVNSYSAADFAQLSAMPSNPTHAGLTAQGWNWSLADAKAYVTKYGRLNVGQTYITSDGKTRIYIKLSDGRISPVLELYLNANTEVDVDWGDGSTHTTWTSTSAGFQSERHAYASAGDYVIAITVVSGSIQLKSSSTSFGTLLTNGNNNKYSSDMAYLNSIQKIEIGSGITSIGNDAFNSSYSFTSITIPDSVTSIEDYAFKNCYSLISVTIPNSIRNIGNYAFYYCTTLTSVAMPNSIRNLIGPYAFYYCNLLKSITISGSVSDIGNYAFYYCDALKSITIPGSVRRIMPFAFNGCSALTSITIPDNVAYIYGYAFYGCYSLGFIKFESTTPPTVDNASAWSNIPTDCIIYVPEGSLSAYTSASNYPSSSTYNYVEY